jgi:hypothetical protein
VRAQRHRVDHLDGNRQPAEPRAAPARRNGRDRLRPAEPASQYGPAAATVETTMYIAWAGYGNGRLNLISTADGGTFTGQYTSLQTSSATPALCTTGSDLYYAWLAQMKATPSTSASSSSPARDNDHARPPHSFEGASKIDRLCTTASATTNTRDLQHPEMGY